MQQSNNMSNTNVTSPLKKKYYKSGININNYIEEPWLLIEIGRAHV